MKRREFIKSSLAASALAGAGQTVFGAQTQEAPSRREGRGGQRPNLVFIFSDQQSYDMVGCHPGSQVVSPHLDRLAERGLAFSHCVSNAPVCTPYRGILLSGQHPFYNGSYHNDLGLMRDIGTTFGDALTQAGYRTGYVGKWHLYGGRRDLPVPPGRARQGFDGTFFTNNVTLEYLPGDAFYWQESGHRSHYDVFEPVGQTNQALDFLREAGKQEDPFALFLSWHPPHNWRVPPGVEWNDPKHYYGAPQEWEELYPLDEIVCRQHGRANLEMRKWYRGYMGLCSLIDHEVGRVVAQLEAMGELDNTLLVFTSDHGDIMGSYGRPGHKQCPEDVSCRVPMLMHWPNGDLPQRRSDLILDTFALMPTLLSFLGIPVPWTCQGRDLSEAIRSADDDAVKSAPLFNAAPSWRGVYTREYTFSEQNFDHQNHPDNLAPPGPYASLDTLYLKEEDPWCESNRFGDPALRELQAELRDESRRWLRAFRDPFVDHTTLLHATTHLENYRHIMRQAPEAVTFKERPIDLLARAGHFG